MAITVGWRQVLDLTQGSVVFSSEGNEILALSDHNGGVWTLHLVLPDDSEILLRNFTESDTQLLISPSHTRFRLSAGRRGAKAWVGTVPPDTAGRLV